MRTSWLATLWSRLRATYWFVPSVVTIGSLLLAVGAVEFDRRYPDAGGVFGWAYTGGAEGARALLSAVAGSIITVVSVTFSVTIVALTVSAQHFGPRLLGNFMRDTAAQIVLGVFIGTFVYCLVVLRTVQGDGDGYDPFVPHMAVTLGLALTLVSVAALIFYVHHVSASLHVTRIAEAVTADLKSAVERLYPEPLGAGADARISPVLPPPEAAAIVARGNGYVQEVDGDRLLEVAGRQNVVIWLAVRPGDFVVKGTAVAHVHPSPADRERFDGIVTGALALGVDRSWLQDAGYAVQQLVEIALHALSPGINEPFTALTCIDRLTQGLAQVACRQIPTAQRRGADGSVRLIALPETFERLLDEAFGPIRRALDGQVTVIHRLLHALATLGSLARRDEDRQAIIRHARQVYTVAERTVPDAHDLAGLEAILQRVLGGRDGRPS